MSLIYVYDGSFEGLLTAVHHAYYNREDPQEIIESADAQPQLFAKMVYIKTDMKKFNDVYRSIALKISKRAQTVVYNVYLSSDEEKATVIYNYLKIGYKMGAAVGNHLSDPWIIKAVRLNKYVTYEINHLSGFLRFVKTKNGIMYAKINPTNNILAHLSRYFADRLSNVAWIIYDEVRNIAASYDTRNWAIYQVDSDAAARFEKSGDEEFYEGLWLKFYNTVAIEGRRNEKLRQHNMPKKYWKNITEMRCE